MFAFFFLAIQLFVTILEFKLTTLAGFILIPFALWNKTSFLAEKVLGNVVASGIKLMVLAIIIGIGSTIFGDITYDLDLTFIQAKAVISLSLLRLHGAVVGQENTRQPACLICFTVAQRDEPNFPSRSLLQDRSPYQSRLEEKPRIVFRHHAQSYRLAKGLWP